MQIRLYLWCFTYTQAINIVSFLFIYFKNEYGDYNNIINNNLYGTESHPQGWEHRLTFHIIINPFTAPACKISRLKDVRTRLQTAYFPVL